MKGRGVIWSFCSCPGEQGCPNCLFARWTRIGLNFFTPTKLYA